MTRRLIPAAVLTSIALTACGGALDSIGEPAGSALNLETDGPGACIDAALTELGPDAMVNEVRSFFEVGDDIDPPLIASDDAPTPGDLEVCEAFYQDPSDPVKLLSIKMDTTSGKFGDPVPVEISVTGDAADFDLNDYLIKASEIDTSVMQPVMDDKTAALDEKYSLWRWESTSLTAPDPFSDVHVFDLRMQGRLAANDVTDGGYIKVGMDGAIVDDSLE